MLYAHLSFFCDWLPLQVGSTPIEYSVCWFSYYRICIFIVMCALYILPLYILVSALTDIWQFNALPPQQLAPFTRASFIKHRIEILAARYTAIFGFIVSCMNSYTYQLPLLPMIIMTMICIGLDHYLLPKVDKVYKEICRRSSILFLLRRFDHLTYHNANTFCDEFNLDVFPVTTFERLCRDNPQTTLFDLKKFVVNAQWHANQLADFKDTEKQLLCVEHSFYRAQS